MRTGARHRHAARHTGADGGRGVSMPPWPTAMRPFILALVALTAMVGVGLNILVGLTGQISLGHVGFYAIGAYTAAILTLQGRRLLDRVSVRRRDRGRRRLCCSALPALRVDRALSRDGDDRLRLHRPARRHRVARPDRRRQRADEHASRRRSAAVFAEREMAVLAVLLAGASLYFFYRLANSAWGRGMVAVRDAEIAARSIGLNPVIIKTAAFALSAAFTGLAGAIFAPLFDVRRAGFLPVLAVDPVPAGGRSSAAPVGCSARWSARSISVVGPELLSGLAEYRLLFFGGLLLVVLWLAPEGVLGTLARWFAPSRSAQPRTQRRFRSGGIPAPQRRAPAARSERRQHRLRRHQGRDRRRLHRRARAGSPASSVRTAPARRRS